MSMDIYAEKGHKVVAENLDWGNDSDKELANKYLVQGEVYTVNYTDVGGWRTEVSLIEIPGIQFNSVHFENLDDYEEDEEE